MPVIVWLIAHIQKNMFPSFSYEGKKEIKDGLTAKFESNVFAQNR